MKNEKNLYVLLVEHDKSNAEYLSKFIASHVKGPELTLETIYDADEAIDEIKRNSAKPQLVILSEPENGKVTFNAELERRIEQVKKENPDTGVIVLSAAGKTETIIDTFRAGAYDMVFKDEKAPKNLVNSILRFVGGTKPAIVFKKRKELEIVR